KPRSRRTNSRSDSNSGSGLRVLTLGVEHAAQHSSSGPSRSARQEDVPEDVRLPLSLLGGRHVAFGSARQVAPAPEALGHSKREAPTLFERTQSRPESFVHAIRLRLEQALRAERVADAAAEAQHRVVLGLPQRAPAGRASERGRLARAAAAM